MRYDLKECGKRIKQFRKERGLTQEQLAEKLNVSQNTIAKIESGLRRPSIDFLLELSEFFGVSTNYLVLGIHPEDMGGSLNEKIDEAITQIDSTIEKLLIKREELLKMKSELEQQILKRRSSKILRCFFISLWTHRACLQGPPVHRFFCFSD